MRGALTRIYFGKRDSCILIKIRPHSRTQVLLWSVCWIRLELHSNMPNSTQLLKWGKMIGRSVEILLMAAGPYRPWLRDTGAWKWTFPKSWFMFKWSHCGVNRLRKALFHTISSFLLDECEERLCWALWVERQNDVEISSHFFLQIITKKGQVTH